MTENFLQLWASLIKIDMSGTYLMSESFLNIALVSKLAWSDHIISGRLQVYDILKNQERDSCPGTRHLRYRGFAVCNRGFMRLFSLGKSRFQSMNSAARAGEPFCPYDSRFLVKGPRNPSEKWEKVHAFLMRLYEEVAEPIPDGLNSNKRPRHGKGKTDSKTLDRSKMKHLPHGTINDYWRQCVDTYPNLGVSRKLFCQATNVGFW